MPGRVLAVQRRKKHPRLGVGYVFQELCSKIITNGFWFKRLEGALGEVAEEGSSLAPLVRELAVPGLDVRSARDLEPYVVLVFDQQLSNSHQRLVGADVLELLLQLGDVDRRRPCALPGIGVVVRDVHA